MIQGSRSLVLKGCSKFGAAVEIFVRLNRAVLVSSTGPIAEEASDLQVVWALEEAYWQYVKNNDLEGYRSLWDDNFIGWPGFSESPLGNSNIADWIAPLHSDPTLVYEYELTKQALRSFGDVVVVHYLCRDFMRSPRTGEELNVDISRVTHTWQRQGDTWKIIAGMSASWIGTESSDKS